MASKVFVDTDVVIDLLIDRQPYANAASIIFDLADRGKLKVYASSLCLNNVHYIVRKELGDQKTRSIIGELLDVLEVLSVSKDDIMTAVRSEFKDFEDAIQHAVAVSNIGISAIITRNTKDYKKSLIPVFNSETYVKMLLNEGYN